MTPGTALDDRTNAVRKFYAVLTWNHDEKPTENFLAQKALNNDDTHARCLVVFRRRERMLSPPLTVRQIVLFWPNLSKPFCDTPTFLQRCTLR